jgi:hypothetical protein
MGSPTYQLHTPLLSWPSLPLPQLPLSRLSLRPVRLGNSYSASPHSIVTFNCIRVDTAVSDGSPLAHKKESRWGFLTDFTQSPFFHFLSEYTWARLRLL